MAGGVEDESYNWHQENYLNIKEGEDVQRELWVFLGCWHLVYKLVYQKDLHNINIFSWNFIKFQANK